MAATHFAPYRPDVHSAPLPPGVVLREAMEEDAAALADIEVQVRGGDAGTRTGQVRRALGAAGAVHFVALVEGGIAGYAKAAWLEKSDDGAAPAGFYLAGCTVLAQFRRRSLGRLLTVRRLEWIAATAAQDGLASEAWYFVNAQNRASLALHQEFGFTGIARAASFRGVGFTGGEGVLLHARLDG